MICVSVIVPIYNVEKYLSKCLDTLISQTLKEIEILVVDDGSLDSSTSIAEKYALVDDRIQVLHKKNGGLSDARNFGLKEAKGEYVAFIDSDDYVKETMLEKMYQKAKQFDADIVCCDLMYVHEDGRQSISVGANFEVSSFKENSSIISINNSACNKIYRTSFMSGKEFPVGQWYEDMATVPLWLAQASKVAYVPESFYYYLQREGSIVHSINEKIFDIYKSVQQVENGLIPLLGKEKCAELMEKLYLDNGLVMTTLRIKNFDNRSVKKDFLRQNIQKLDEHCPNWYSRAIRQEYSLKQKIVFTLLKMKLFSVVVRIYR